MNTLELAIRHDIVSQVKNRVTGEKFILVLDGAKCWAVFASISEVQDFAASVAVDTGCQSSVRDLGDQVMLRFE